MRKLIFVPIIHNFAECKIEKSQDYWDKIEALWDLIESEIEKLNLNYNGLRLFNDSWSEVSARNQNDYLIGSMLEGSRNFELLLNLTKKGAILEITEYYLLLVCPYYLIRFLKRLKYEPVRLHQIRRRLMLYVLEYCGLLEKERVISLNVAKRDKWIAANLSKFLQQGETGILLMGAAHKVEQYLPDDIQVIHLPRIELEVVRIWAESMGVNFADLLRS